MSQPRTKTKSALTEEVELDQYGCLSLAVVKRCFNAPINEEMAWALIYQSIRALENSIAQQHQIVSVSSADDILIQDNGTVHHSTWCDCGDQISRKYTHGSACQQRPVKSCNVRRRGRLRSTISSDYKAIESVGLVIYAALDDDELGAEEERELTPELAEIITNMTSATGDDEGIESDQYDTEFDEGPNADQNRFRCRIDSSHTPDIRESFEKQFRSSDACSRFLKECAAHLSISRSEADRYFDAVCRGMVLDALEIASFIQKVAKRGAEVDDETMQEIALQDWRRDFKSVLHAIRTGVKLRHINYTKVHIDDDSKITVKRNAHDVILHFIRSRPTLKPVGERKLKPQQKELTPHEALMESIRVSSGRSSLRKTKGPNTKSLRMPVGYETSRCEEDEFNTETKVDSSTRRKVTLDPSLVRNMLNFSDDESEDEVEQLNSARYSSQLSDGSTVGDDESRIDSAISNQKQVVSPDNYRIRSSVLKTKAIAKTSINYSKMAELFDGIDGCSAKESSGAMEGTTPNSFTKTHRRRHSLTVCETPARAKTASDCTALNTVDDKYIQHDRPTQRVVLITQLSNITASTMSGTSASSSTSNSRSSTPVLCSDSTNLPYGEPDYDLNTPQMHAKLHSEFIHSDDWATALQTLELTLDEVIHIRSVLTKAELEGLPLDGTLKEDVEKGKVCFLCMKTRFGFFSRGCKCELCKRQVCAKCSTKMSIPSDDFTQTPVISLEAPNSSGRAGSVPNSPGRNRHATNVSSSVLNNHSHGDNLESLANLPKAQFMTSSLTTIPADEIVGDNNSKVTEFTRHDGGRRSFYLTSSSGHCSLPYEDIKSTSSGMSYFNRKNASQGFTGSGSLEGPELSVCVDCKEMVLQVIRAQKTAQRMKMARSLFTGCCDDQETKDPIINLDVWGEEFY